MQEQFHESQKLPKETLKSLIDRSSNRGIVHFAIQYALLLGSAAVIVLRYGQPWWQWVPAMFVFGLMTMSMFALGHETVHKTAFDSLLLNEIVCWLVCVPIYYVPAIFRHFHFAHHRHTHEPGLDPEISLGGKPGPGVASSVSMYLGWLSGLPLLLYKVGVMVAASVGHGRLVWQELMPYVPDRAKTRVRWEARAALSIHIAYFVVAWYWLPGLFFLLWAQWLGHVMQAVYLITEHNGLPHEGHAIERTRTMLTNPLLKFVMWNMPYHAEHHAYPAVPWHALPELHEHIKTELKHTDTSYARFHGRVVSQLSKGQPFVDTLPPTAG